MVEGEVCGRDQLEELDVGFTLQHHFRASCIAPQITKPMGWGVACRNLRVGATQDASSV